MNRTIETLFSPALFPYLSGGVSGKQVVIIDILRATTTICVSLDNGCKQMVAVSATEDSILFRERGYLLAGERNGFKLEGFDFGNSPQEFTPERVGGASIVITTTNGTQALVMSNAADRIWVSSFYNLSATVEAILEQGLPVVLFCAGWKNRFNLEDANHVQRFKSMHAESDLDVCLRTDVSNYAVKAEIREFLLSDNKVYAGELVQYVPGSVNLQ